MAHSTTIRTPIRTTTALLGLAGVLTLGACSAEPAGETPATGAGGATEGGASGPDGGTQSLGPGATAGAETTDAPAGFTASLQDVEGELGSAEIREAGEALEFRVQASGMEPGFYGLHMHETGECNPDSAAPDDPEEIGAFLSAGSHIGADESEHPDHAGDLPVLLVQESGEASLTFETDRLTAEDFQDEDGAALMLHSDPDNYANIPGRYAPDGPDEDTTGTGDAGFRLACGVIEPAA
ncbi:superoxide dismutase family protein [Citricoccus sp. I39-566]|uniref:superoxide dismutase family protein n=1 Tax=Citricoccus sp. I39-566 TaxID=3073268 RepID=UPI00286A5D12|nr:superoxide dismutase family protein [Citricoccus sp. I39-566]WMY78009.1 superoxide dismutase family protein [Citricoccus sp. I39-566]